MRHIILRKQFKRDLKRAKRNSRHDLNKLYQAVEHLVNTGNLPGSYQPHPLTGDWKPAWECHIQPDFLLIYQLTKHRIKLIRCGSHAELFH